MKPLRSSRIKRDSPISTGEPPIKDDPLLDEFGRTLEEQLQDQIAWEWHLAEERYRQRNYSSSIEHQDGEELPHGLYVTHDKGPQYSRFEYFPHWHYHHAIEALDDGYEQLLPNGGVETVYFWYDPRLNAVIQEEVEPGVYAGVFDQQEEAILFLERMYDDPEDVELYEARMTLCGSVDELL